MQKTFFDLEYNPKIDYLITKNLLYSWPRKFNEFDLRRAFKKKLGSTSSELKKIKKIRDYLRKNHLVNFTKKNYEEFMKILSKKDYEYHYIIPLDQMKVEHLDKFITYLKAIDSSELAYYSLATMILYVCAKNNDIVIPYRGTLKRVLNIEGIDAYTAIAVLKERTRHSNIKHDAKENEIARIALKEKKNEFMHEFKTVKAYGVFGSFALGKENEYSDIDLLVISDEEKNYIFENDIKTFWRRYINIEIDVKIVKEDDMDQELTECMKKTLRMVN